MRLGTRGPTLHSHSHTHTRTLTITLAPQLIPTACSHLSCLHLTLISPQSTTPYHPLTTVHHSHPHSLPPTHHSTSGLRTLLCWTLSSSLLCSHSLALSLLYLRPHPSSFMRNHAHSLTTLAYTSETSSPSPAFMLTDTSLAPSPLG